MMESNFEAMYGPQTPAHQHDQRKRCDVMRLHLIPDPDESYEQSYEQTVERADLIAAHLNVTASLSKSPEPLVWQPMDTCPMVEGRLADEAWVAYEWGVIRFPVGTYIVRDEGRSETDRVGWLPGNLPEADLPEVPK